MGHHPHDGGRCFKMRLERCSREEYNARVPLFVRENVPAHLLCRGGGPGMEPIAWCVVSCSCADCEWRPPMTVAEMRTARRCVVCEGAGDDRSPSPRRRSGWFRGNCFPDNKLCSAHTLYCDCDNCSFMAKTTPIDAGTAVECFTRICDAKFHPGHVPHMGYCSDCADLEDPETLVGADSCEQSTPSSRPAPPIHAMITNSRRRIAPTDRSDRSGERSRLSFDVMARK